MSDSQILQCRASRLAAEAYREKIARLEAELAAAKERIVHLEDVIRRCGGECAWITCLNEGGDAPSPTPA